MTVESTVSRVQYSTNGTTGPFSVPFYFINDDDLEVTYANTSGTETVLTLSADYAVTGEGDPAGGSVTTTTAYAAGGTITIRRVPSLLQETDYTDTDRFPAVAHERALDRAMMAAQYLKEITDRCIQIPVSGTESVSLPDASDRAGKTLTFDSNGNVSATAPADGTSAALAADLLSYATPTRGTGMVGHDDAMNYTGGAGLGLIARGVSVRNPSFGIAGDGVTNDTSSILAAANRAVALGVPLIFDGSIHAIDSITFPDDLAIEFNGATLQDRLGTTSNTTLITFGARARIDTLKVSIPAGIRRDRAIQISGSGARIGEIVLSSVDQQANTSDSNDCGVRVLGTDFQIGRITVTNYDRAVSFEGAERGVVGGLDVTSYMRGVWISDCKRLTIGRSYIRTASPNASVSPGHNGLLMSCSADYAQVDVTVSDWTIEGSGEHGIRIGGDYSHDGIRIVRPTVRNAGGCSIKVLGTDLASPGQLNEGIWIVEPLCEDGATSTSAADNRCGILLEFAYFCHVIAPIIRKRGTSYSSAYGIRVNGCADVVITSPQVSDALYDNILIHAQDGNNSRISVNGGVSSAAGRHGINVIVDSTQTAREIHVDGINLRGNTLYGFNVAVTGTLVESLIDAKVYNNTGGAGACNSSAMLFDLFGAPGSTPLSGIVAGNGSRWSDGTTLNVRKAGSWAAL